MKGECRAVGSLAGRAGIKLLLMETAVKPLLSFLRPSAHNTVLDQWHDSPDAFVREEKVTVAVCGCSIFDSPDLSIPAKFSTVELDAKLCIDLLCLQQ